MERCPICRARWKDASICYRCGVDLSLAIQVEEEAALWEQQAVRQLAVGDTSAAHQALARALRLQRTPLTSFLISFVGETHKARD